MQESLVARLLFEEGSRRDDADGSKIGQKNEAHGPVYDGKTHALTAHIRWDNQRSHGQTVICIPTDCAEPKGK